MGPNMTRLFAVAKQNLYHTQDGVNIPSQAVLTARSQVDCLLNDHGEALIAALEKLTHFASEVTHDWSIEDDAELAADAAMIEQCKHLLAQLESEAQP